MVSDNNTIVGHQRQQTAAAFRENIPPSVTKLDLAVVMGRFESNMAASRNAEVTKK